MQTSSRTLPFADLNNLPGDTPEIQTVLDAGEVITGHTVALTPALLRSIYIKARDRESYAIANSSAAVGLETDSDIVRDVRIGPGGVALMPWRATVAEAALRGSPLTEQAMQDAATAAFADARIFEHNAFKVVLGQNVIVHARTTLRDLEG